MTQELFYNEERDTWNLFVNGEWYYEGTYEQCEEMFFTNLCDEDDQPSGYDEY